MPGRVRARSAISLGLSARLLSVAARLLLRPLITSPSLFLSRHLRILPFYHTLLIYLVLSCKELVEISSWVCTVSGRCASRHARAPIQLTMFADPSLLQPDDPTRDCFGGTLEERTARDFHEGRDQWQVRVFWLADNFSDADYLIL